MRSLWHLFLSGFAVVLFHLTRGLSALLRRVSTKKWRRLRDESLTQAVRPEDGLGKQPLEQHLEKALAPISVLAVENKLPYPHLLPRPQHGLLPGWANELQAFLQNQLSRHTRTAYEGDLRQFFRFVLQHLPDLDIQKLRSEHIILFRRFLEEGRLPEHGRPLQKSSINRKIATIKSFMKWLNQSGHMQHNPAQWVKGFPQTQDSKLQGFSDREVMDLLNQTRLSSRSGALHNAILHCLFYLGLRKGELAALKMEHLGEDRGVPILRVPGKGHRIRTIPLTPRVSTALQHYFALCERNPASHDEPLFLATKNPRRPGRIQHLTPYAVTYIVLKYAKAAGVLKRVSPHSCRATCISNALDRRATHRAVQHLAGWTTPLMIQRYDKRREELRNSAAFVVDYAAASP